MRVVLGLLIALVVAAPAGAAEELTGSTIISAPEGGGVTTVRLGADVGVPFIMDIEKAFAFTPGDRATAMIMRRRGGGKPFSFFLAYQPPPGLVPCVALDCESPMLWVTTDGGGKSYMDAKGVPRKPVAAGDYDLYLAAEAGPAQMRLSLPELGGEAGQIQLPGGGGADLRTLREYEGAGRVLGAAGTLARPGASAILLRSMSASSAATWIESCEYEGAPADPLAYTPTCPGAADSFTFIAASSSMVALGSMNLNAPAGTTGLGGNAVDAGPGFFDGLAIWMPYRPAEPPPPPAAPVAALPAAPPVVLGGRLEILSARARLARGRIGVRLRCAGPGRCAGVLRSPRTANAAFDLPAGVTRTVSLRVRGRARGRLSLTAQGPNGLRATRRIRLTR